MSEENNDGRFNLSRRKALAGIGSIGAATALGGIGTYAQLSDTEENSITFTAGGLDGEISWSGSYNSEPVDGSRESVILDAGNSSEFNTSDADGAIASVDVAFEDVKPGDYGCVNFEITVESNEAWVASCVDLHENIDYKNFEPEIEADADLADSQINAGPEASDSFDASNVGSEPGTKAQGELAQNIYTIPYYDSDDTCTFFDPELQSFNPQTDYDGANPASFWTNSQDTGLKPMTTGGEPISKSHPDGEEYDLVARNLRDVAQNIRAVDTAHWSNADDTLDPQSAPDGATVDAGCVMLDGDGSDNNTNNTQGVAPLKPGTPLYFGYDYHIPFGVGNVIQGDRTSISLEFVFLQSRHTEAPDFTTYSPGSNTNTGGT